MKRSLFHVALLIGGLVMFAGCSDDTKVTKKDTGTKKDGIQIVDQPAYPDTGTTDTGTTKKDTGGTKKDTGGTKKDTGGTKKDVGKPIEGGTGKCDATCTAQARNLCVKDTSGDCVECSTSADCTANPMLMGPTCDSYNYCTCAKDADCTGNPNGNKCDLDPQVTACHCTVDADCTVTPYTKCDALGGYSGWCVKPCTSDTDCQTMAGRPFCNASGLCAQCKVDGDCKSPGAPFCTKIGCMDCKVDGDCANAIYGSHCDLGHRARMQLHDQHRLPERHGPRHQVQDQQVVRC